MRAPSPLPPPLFCRTASCLQDLYEPNTRKSSVRTEESSSRPRRACLKGVLKKTSLLLLTEEISDSGERERERSKHLTQLWSREGESLHAAAWMDVPAMSASCLFSSWSLIGSSLSPFLLSPSIYLSLYRSIRFRSGSSSSSRRGTARDPSSPCGLFYPLGVRVVRREASLRPSCDEAPLTSEIFFSKSLASARRCICRNADVGNE